MANTAAGPTTRRPCLSCRGATSAPRSGVVAGRTYPARCSGDCVRSLRCAGRSAGAAWRRTYRRRLITSPFLFRTVPRAADYGPPVQLGSGTRLVRASGSYGEDLSGSPLLHIHGVLAEPSGQAHGGHPVLDRCMVGPAGVRAILLLSVGFKRLVDRETRTSLFFPSLRGEHTCRNRRSWRSTLGAWPACA